MTTSTYETEIALDPDVPLVRITREFDAAPEKVFRAHTDPALLTRWLGPRDIEMRIDQFDCRTGGSYRYIHVSDGTEYGFRGCFHEVRSPCTTSSSTSAFQSSSASSPTRAFSPSKDD